jgi:hypothetical protein
MIRVSTVNEGKGNAVIQVLPAEAVSPAASWINHIEASTPASSSGESSSEDPLELQLFNNAAEIKILYGDYLRHLSLSWRPLIFRQVDRLLDPIAWNQESSIIVAPSFRTFLRFVDHARPDRIPSLGVGPDGNLLSAWIVDSLKLFVTFLPADRVNATFMSRTDRGDEQVIAWQGPIVSLKERIVREGASACIWEVANEGKAK